MVVRPHDERLGLAPHAPRQMRAASSGLLSGDVLGRLLERAAEVARHLDGPGWLRSGTATMEVPMATRIDLTFDCRDASRLAAFWKLALGYVDEPPPAPYATRQEWLAAVAPDEEDEGEGAWLCDPDGTEPRLSLLEVPEPKVAKNRLHIDVRVAGTGSPEQPLVPGQRQGRGTDRRRRHDAACRRHPSRGDGRP